MNTLCIIQARYHSQRLPGKMLLTLDDPVHGTETLIARAWRLAGEAFGAENCWVAIPRRAVSSPLWTELLRIRAQVDATFDGPEEDVLGRFYHCALSRNHTGVIHRWTPDDPFKGVHYCGSVAGRPVRGHEWPDIHIPVERGGEAFTFKQLCEAQAMTPANHEWREHLGHNPWLFEQPRQFHPLPPGEGWTIDTEADLHAARARLAREGK